MKKLFARLGALSLVLTPSLASAQAFGEITTFFGKITTFINDVLIPLVFAIALLVFIWGVFTYFILGGHDPDKQKEGRGLMMYAVVGFVLMVSIFGIVNLVAGGLGFSDDQNIKNIPNVPTNNT